MVRRCLGRLPLLADAGLKTLKRINQLIRDIERNGCMQGIGKTVPSPVICRANTATASAKKTGSSTIWKMGGSISLIAEAIMEINNLGLTSEP